MITPFLLLIAFFIIFILLRYILLPYKTYCFYRKFGRGNFLPFIGELYQRIKSLKKHGDADYLYQHIHDEGDNKKIYVSNFLNKVKLVLIDPEVVKEFYQNYSENYIKDQFFSLNFKRFIQKGIFVTEGEEWKQSREIFHKAFEFDNIQSLSASISEIANKHFQKMISQKQLQSVDTIHEMIEITGSVIILSFFGEDLSHLNFQGFSIHEALSHVFRTLGSQTFSVPFFLFGKSFYSLGLCKSHRKFNCFLEEFKKFLLNQLNKKISEIEEEIKKTKTTTNKGILAGLIKSNKINNVSRDQLFAEFISFYMAGMDTTGHFLGMIIYFITQNKEIYQTLQKEIDTNKDSSPKNLASLPYLNATMDETLRYYGPANFLFDRVALKDHELAGIPIKKGVNICLYAMTIHRNSKYFKEPHKFNPQRWIEKSNDNLVPYSYLPFSEGKRNCIGVHLAKIETRIILNLFIQTFDFSCPEDYQLQMGYKFLLEPIDPLRIKLSPRNIK